VIDFTFIMDMSAPLFSSESPADGSVIAHSSPDISIIITDALSGVDHDGTTIIIDGIVYDSSSPGFSFHGDTLIFRSSLVPLSWEGGDTVHITVRSQDMPDLCPPNESDKSFSFSLPAGGPVPIAITPAMAVISLPGSIYCHFAC
jgi:hypothetical protein